MDNEVPMIQCLTHLSTTISMYTHLGIRVQEHFNILLKVNR
jgi:hypothetical protein